MPSTTFMTLPYELRARILDHVVKQEGSFQLNYPAWIGHREYVQPIIQVCHQLRVEAIQVIYHVNEFWLTYPPGQRYTDGRIDSGRSVITVNDHLLSEAANFFLREYANVEAGPRGDLMSPLPWLYSRVLQDTRLLHLTLRPPEADDQKGWTTVFPSQLNALVGALDHGRRLRKLRLHFQLANNANPAEDACYSAFEALRALKFPGRIHVMRPGPGHNIGERRYFRELLKSIMSMDDGDGVKQGRYRSGESRDYITGCTVAHCV